MAERLRFIGKITRQAGRKFFSHNGPFLASALAFNLLLYVIPLSLVMVSLLGYTVLDSEQAIRRVQAVLQEFLPRSQRAFADNVAEIVANRGFLGLTGFASFLVFSSFLYGTVRIVLNRVFETRTTRSFFHGLGMDILMMFVTAVLAVTASGTAWIVSFGWTAVEQLPGLAFLFEPLLRIVSKVLSLITTGLFFYVLYRFPPATTLSSKALMVAAGAGTVLFQSAQWAFGWYVLFAERSLAFYGVLGGVLFFFVWLYYASAVFVLGAEIGWAYEGQRKAQMA